MQHWRNLFLAGVVAIICFGGSCECKSKTTHAPVGAPRAVSR
jgi:hypothetical protein